MAKEPVKVLAKMIKNTSLEASKKTHSNILTEEPTPPPPDFSNLKDHYTESHHIAFNNCFFGKKMCGNEVCKTREERDRIYDVVKNWNHSKIRS